MLKLPNEQLENTDFNKTGFKKYNYREITAKRNEKTRITLKNVVVLYYETKKVFLLLTFALGFLVSSFRTSSNSSLNRKYVTNLPK
jgi:hypothetical protein